MTRTFEYPAQPDDLIKVKDRDGRTWTRADTTNPAAKRISSWWLSPGVKKEIWTNLLNLYGPLKEVVEPPTAYQPPN